MNNEIIFSIIIPFAGTLLGSALVYIFKDKISENILRAFSGFAAGVMIAASIWSLIIPSFDASSDKGNFALVPVLIGLFIGFAFLMFLDKVIPHMHANENEAEGPKSNLKKSTMTSLAVALHNLPEGLAVGIVLASSQAGNSNVSITMAIALAVGIAIQNLPEGAIVSVSLNASGVNKHKSFIIGTLTGIIEPIGALLTFLLVNLINPALPYLLSFAAGSMLYVVVEELIPDMSKGKHSHIGTICFALGFALMMVLDFLLG